jgi:quercetin dioxygenase-like cupin family protein
MNTDAVCHAQPDGWDGVEVTTYKDEPGTWVSVTRQVLFDSEKSKFQMRYFNIAPGGYSSYERHVHEHCVMVLDGHGEVRIGDEWHKIGPRDVVRVFSGMPHQFRAATDSSLGIICIVDAERDNPEQLGNSAPAQASV